jgi:hypothetical protein
MTEENCEVHLESLEGGFVTRSALAEGSNEWRSINGLNLHDLVVQNSLDVIDASDNGGTRVLVWDDLHLDSFPFLTITPPSGQKLERKREKTISTPPVYKAYIEK